MKYLILISVFLPILSGGILLLESFMDHLDGTGESSETIRGVHYMTGAILCITALITLITAWSGEKDLVFFKFMNDIYIYFHVDSLGALFATFMTLVWVLAGFYAFLYMKHEKNEKRYFGFYLIVYGVLLALDFSGNLVTFYLFYELMTLTSMPLVFHNESREAIMAALKYLFYSMCGAYLSLFGIFFMYRFCNTLSFTPGGALNETMAASHMGIILISAMCMIIGFGAKAGMFPLHAWLPAAHPVAPSPASAVLSSIIVKAGVLGLIRVVYYIIGPDFLKGTWVQYVWIILAALTVFMGSMLAFREKVFKKRLAYSTVSQVSYILLGLAIMNPAGMTGALLHVVFHAFVKCALFMTAGIIIFQTGKTDVRDFKGIGKEMPVTLWSYTLASLALIGIPPACGFISKWYLAQGYLESSMGVFNFLVPAVLLISALLTAGYLLPITMNGFFPGEEGEAEKYHLMIPGRNMLIPLAALAALALILGIFPNPLINFLSGIVDTIL